MQKAFTASNSDLFFDSHCHFDFSVFDQTRHTIWQQCQRIGIKHLLMPGVSPDQWITIQSLSENLNNTYHAVGLHPWWVQTYQQAPSHQQTLTEQLSAFMQHKRCLAIGECGLDGSIEIPLEQQLPFFTQQLALAHESKLPIIIHAHKAHNLMIQALKHIQPQRGGVIHGFSGSVELATAYWKLGFYLGIGGTITYQRAKKTRSMLEAMPLDAIILETDAPDMPLQGQQGTANSPINIPLIAQALADIKTLPLSHVARYTYQNTLQLFSLNDSES